MDVTARSANRLQWLAGSWSDSSSSMSTEQHRRFFKEIQWFRFSTKFFKFLLFYLADPKSRGPLAVEGFRRGPSSVESVRRGEIGFAFDTPYVLCFKFNQYLQKLTLLLLDVSFSRKSTLKSPTSKKTRHPIGDSRRSLWTIISKQILHKFIWATEISSW